MPPTPRRVTAFTPVRRLGPPLRQRALRGRRRWPAARGLERSRRPARDHGIDGAVVLRRLAIPQGTAGGLGPFPERAASAAALLGIIQMMSGLVVNGLSSLWYDGTPRPMVTLNAMCALAALAAYGVFLRPRPGARDRLSRTGP